MSESERWRKIGEALGRAIAEGIESSGLGSAVRDVFAKVYGKCRSCDAPLAGPSPEQICEPCHAAELLSGALGGGPVGES